MRKQELLDKLIEITNEGFTSVKLLPDTIKKHSEEAYSCILEALEEKVEKSYIKSQDITDFEDNILSVRIEFMSSPQKVGIKEISLIRDGNQIIILQHVMNVNIKRLIDITGKKLSIIILEKLEEQKSK